MTTMTQSLDGATNTLRPEYLSSSYVRSSINQFANKANDLANQLLAPKNSPYSGPVVIRNNYYSYSPFYSPWFYSHPSVIVVDNGRGRRSNEQNNEKNILLGVVLTVGALVMTYFVGSALSSYQDADRESKEARESQKKFNNYRAHVSPHDLPLLEEVRVATSLKGRICSRIRDSVLWDLALRIGITAGLVAGAVGSFTCLPVLGVGLTIGALSAGAMLFKWGFESTDRKNILDAQELRASVLKLKDL